MLELHLIDATKLGDVEGAIERSDWEAIASLSRACLSNYRSGVLSSRPSSILPEGWSDDWVAVLETIEEQVRKGRRNTTMMRELWVASEKMLVAWYAMPCFVPEYSIRVAPGVISDAAVSLADPDLQHEVRRKGWRCAADALSERPMTTFYPNEVSVEFDTPSTFVRLGAMDGGWLESALRLGAEPRLFRITKREASTVSYLDRMKVSWDESTILDLAEHARKMSEELEGWAGKVSEMVTSICQEALDRNLLVAVCERHV